MSSGLCPRCGDASGERHLCVPPFLDRAAVTTNASTPPQGPYVTRLDAETARLQRQLTGAEADRHALYEEVCRLRAGLQHVRSEIRHRDCGEWDGDPHPCYELCDCGAYALREMIDALLAGPTSGDPPSPLTVEIVRLRALIARYADVIGEDASDILPGVPF